MSGVPAQERRGYGVGLQLEAVTAGRACWRKLPERERTEDERDAFNRISAEFDSMRRPPVRRA